MADAAQRDAVHRLVRRLGRLAHALEVVQNAALAASLTISRAVRALVGMARVATSQASLAIISGLVAKLVVPLLLKLPRCRAAHCVGHQCSHWGTVDCCRRGTGHLIGLNDVVKSI